MRVLLDTHIIIWAFENNPRLSQAARDILTDENAMLYCSDTSAWEVALKHFAKPDEIIDEKRFMALCEQSDLNRLSIQREHILHTSEFEQVHHYPLDRLLMAQAECEHMKLLTHDGNIARYDLPFVIPV